MSITRYKNAHASNIGNIGIQISKTEMVAYSHNYQKQGFSNFHKKLYMDKKKKISGFLDE